VAAPVPAAPVPAVPVPAVPVPAEPVPAARAGTVPCWPGFPASAGGVPPGAFPPGVVPLGAVPPPVPGFAADGVELAGAAGVGPPGTSGVVRSWSRNSFSRSLRLDTWSAVQGAAWWTLAVLMPCAASGAENSPAKPAIVCCAVFRSSISDCIFPEFIPAKSTWARCIPSPGSGAAGGYLTGKRG
jgi:hypothetical protein